MKGQSEKTNSLWHCPSSAQRKLKHPCVITTVSITNPVHSPTPATAQKINSTPAQTCPEPLTNVPQEACFLGPGTAECEHLDYAVSEVLMQ